MLQSFWSPFLKDLFGRVVSKVVGHDSPAWEAHVALVTLMRGEDSKAICKIVLLLSEKIFPT